MKNKKIVVANWKMNPENLTEAKRNFLEIKRVASKLLNVQTIICPPYIYLNELVSAYKGHRIAIGAQDVFEKNKGPYVGMVSPAMLENIGVEYVIVGHSSLRVLGDTDDLINSKIKHSLSSGLKPVLCVGERSRGDEAKHFNFIKNQILSALDGISKNALKNILITYEPIWAISNNSGGQSMEYTDIYEMVIFIKKVLVDRYGVKTKLPNILYGGSVSPKNTKRILVEGNVDGLLVGKASLDPKKFNQILKVVDNQ